jgi:hypothetical protein
MRTRKVVIWLTSIAGAIALFVPTAFAQNVSTGTIAGTVKDSSGGVLPGVTVQVASPALIEKARDVVTDGQGQYKVVDLRPGSYSVTFTLSGFQTVRREAIDLSAGFTATINADLPPASLEQTVLVTAANPVVDVQNVSTQSVLTRERLNALPATQSILGISQVTLGMVPTASGSTGLAADVGGNKGEQISSMAVHGGNQADQISMVDGLSMQHTLSTGSGFFRLFFFNQIMAQEINVVSRGGSGEVQTAGVQVNMISKSGSNAWRIEGGVNGTNSHFNAENLDDYLISRGVATPPSIDKIYDFGIGVGGPLVKDKLWVYGSTRAWGASEIITANYYNATQGTFTYTPDLERPADRPSPNRDASANFTWQATSKDRFTFFPMYQQNCNCRRGVNNSPPTAPEASEMGRFKPLFNIASTWNRAVSDRLLLQAGFMYVDTTAHYAPAPEVEFGDVQVTEQSNGVNYTSRVDTALNRFHDPQGNGYVSASYVTGSHSLKAGFAFLRGYLDQNADFTSQLPIAYTVRKATASSPPTPVSITQYALPTRQHNDILTTGFYVQDQWTLRKMTLNLGIRYDSLHAWVPAQTRPGGYFTPEYSFDKVNDVPNWKDINPRVGIAYDLFGNGKTAVKASFGRYIEAESLSIASANNPANAIVTNTTRTWTDPTFSPLTRTAAYTPPCDLRNPAANGNGVGSCGPISNTGFGTPAIGTTYSRDVLVGWNIRPAIWQGSATISQELRPGLGVTFGYYRTSYDNIRVTRNTAVPTDAYDPFCVTLAPDERLPGGGGGDVCGYYNVKPEFFGKTKNEVTQASNFGKPTQVYNGFDINVNARVRNGISFVGGMSDGQTVINNCFIVNSAQDLRYCEVKQPWEGNLQFKMTLIYPLPFWGLRASAVYQNLAGVPVLATNYSVTNAQVAPSLGRNLSSCGAAAVCNATVTLTNIVEPNTEYESRLQQFDLRFSKVLRFQDGSITGNFDIYNLFNANTILNRNNVYAPTGTTYGRPTDILAGRLFKFGVQFSF